MALPVHPVEDVSGVLGLMGIESGAVEEAERIEDRGALSGLRRACDPAQRVLGRLSAIAGRDQHGEGGIVRSLVGEMALQADAGDRVDQVAKVDALGRRNPRDIAKGMTLGPFHQRLAAPLVRNPRMPSPCAPEAIRPGCEGNRMPLIRRWPWDGRRMSRPGREPPRSHATFRGTGRRHRSGGRRPRPQSSRP